MSNPVNSSQETTNPDSLTGIKPKDTLIENLGLKPRRSTTALLLNIRTFTKYMLKCEVWKKPI
ncbi:hypothetical protein, partial [Microcystis wesenbergii]|uniref:hypothetical protein n=1 Tax=Microcystis wesenbergii TaxID=44823 RepID=UPI001A7E63A6